jgi:hypothetical protein
MSFVYGVIGFVGFEALRIYKCLWGKRPIVPAEKAWWYTGTVVTLGIFAGIFANAVSPDNNLEALYLGFSVPCGLKALLEPTSNGRRYRRGDETDDIVIEPVGYLSYMRNIYLGS